MKVSIAPSGWHDNQKEDVQAVLASAAQLSPYFPNRPPERLEVCYAADGPRVLYEKAASGATVIRLSATGTFWLQYTYQFAHDFCHVLSHYAHTKSDTNPNYRFEESLCEAASLFVLKRMTVTWESTPTYPHWNSYAPSLARYAEDIVKKYDLPHDVHLPDWYKANALALSQNSTLRKIGRRSRP